ncbi:MAG: acyl-CoA dehydratase activase [Thermodesulfobacteriota bacterium]|nr:acyl-CoA dehydratase activase [Thermodesulfobacteriota bacterium]
MIVAGCDIGSLTAKVVIMSDGKILASPVIKSKSRPEESAKEVMDMALSTAGLPMDAIEYCIGTGYGRKKIPFVKEVISEIACHGKGAKFLLPTARTVIDIGGQDCKTMKIDGSGKLIKFITNDKCAAGTGRFLEVMANMLGVRLDELGPLSARARSPLALASTCTVWAQAEVVRNFNEGKSIEDIGASVNEAMAKRVAILANSVGVEKDVCMSGGVAKNIGVVKGLERLLGVKIKKLKLDPQIVGALGAAVFAKEKLEGGTV